MDNLQDYSSIRSSKFQVDKKTVRAVEKLAKKYAISFGKPSLSVHNFRHSFTTRYHAEINNVPKLRRKFLHTYWDRNED
jgi:integrase